MRSRAVRRPPARCFASLSSPPPASAAAWRRRNSSRRSDIRSSVARAPQGALQERWLAHEFRDARDHSKEDRESRELNEDVLVALRRVIFGRENAPSCPEHQQEKSPSRVTAQSAMKSPPIMESLGKGERSEAAPAVELPTGMRLNKLMNAVEWARAKQIADQ